MAKTLSITKSGGKTEIVVTNESLVNKITAVSDAMEVQKITEGSTAIEVSLIAAKQAVFILKSDSEAAAFSLTNLATAYTTIKSQL